MTDNLLYVDSIRWECVVGSPGWLLLIARVISVSALCIVSAEFLLLRLLVRCDLIAEFILEWDEASDIESICRFFLYTQWEATRLEGIVPNASGG